MWIFSSIPTIGTPSLQLFSRRWLEGKIFSVTLRGEWVSERSLLVCHTWKSCFAVTGLSWYTTSTAGRLTHHLTPNKVYSCHLKDKVNTRSVFLCRMLILFSDRIKRSWKCYVYAMNHCSKGFLKYNNSPFYSSVLNDRAFEQKRGWSWLTNLTTFQNVNCSVILLTSF